MTSSSCEDFHESSAVMSRSVLISIWFTLTIVCLSLKSVAGYENAYDLLERRNQRFYEPRYFQTTMFYDDSNRFFTQKRKPQSEYATLNPYYSKFGNGYDNLGNGIPVGHSHPFSRAWRFERRPFQERSFNNFDFEGHHPTSRYQNSYGNYLSKGFYPSAPRSYPSSGAFGNGFRSHGNTDFTKVDRFLEDNEGKKEKKTNEFYQRSNEGINTDSLKREKAGEQLHTDQLGENKSSLRSNKVVKKGRTTKGFAVHHHKDETGNSTTFFDEISDFGGQSDLRDITDGFGTRRTLEHITHKGDEKYFKENEAQTGNYGSGLLVGNQRFEKDFSSMGGLEESENKFHTENDGLGLAKSYQYLNGDRFDYTEPHTDEYY